MVHRLDFDLGLHRLAAAADGGGSGDYFLPERDYIVFEYLLSQFVCRLSSVVCNVRACITCSRAVKTISKLNPP